MGKVQNESGKSDFYETFTSGKGPVIPDGMEKDFDTMDGVGLGNYTKNAISGLDLEVPEVPSTKR